MSINVHIFSHVRFELLGSLNDWILSKNAVVSHTRFDLGDQPPQDLRPDLLIVLGGPMGVHDQEDYPWLDAEKRAIQKAIDNETPLLGICLGAQLVADQLGARVHADSGTEIGWFPVKRIESAPKDLCPENLVTMHWHNDQFDLPEGATPLFESEVCACQAFSFGDHIYAFQFHPESTMESVESLIEKLGHQIQPGPFVQLPNQIRAHYGQVPENRKFLFKVLDRLIGYNDHFMR